MAARPQTCGDRSHQASVTSLVVLEYTIYLKELEQLAGATGRLPCQKLTIGVIER
jgi:hypothetical protein